jgi:Putative transposase
MSGSSTANAHSEDRGSIALSRALYHRVAVSNSRLVVLKDKGVTFKWKDCRLKGQERYAMKTLDTHELIRRFLIRVLPQGLHGIGPDQPSTRQQTLRVSASATAWSMNGRLTSNRIKGLLFAQGIRDIKVTFNYDSLQIDKLVTGEGRCIAATTAARSLGRSRGRRSYRRSLLRSNARTTKR